MKKYCRGNIKIIHDEHGGKKKLGENGYNYVINHNTYNQIAEQYIKCIEETISNYERKAH